MRTISFVIALSLTFFGAFALIYLLLFADGWRGWMVTGADLVLTVGALWLYSNYYFDATPKSNDAPGTEVPWSSHKVSTRHDVH